MSDKKVIVMNSNTMSYHSVTNNVNNIDTLNIENIISTEDSLNLNILQNNIIKPAIRIQNNTNSCNIECNLNVNANVNINENAYFKDNITNYNTSVIGNFRIHSTQSVNQATDYGITNGRTIPNERFAYSSILTKTPDLFKFELYHVDSEGRYYVTIENINNSFNTLYYDIPTLYNIYDVHAVNHVAVTYKSTLYFEVDDLRSVDINNDNIVKAIPSIPSDNFIYFKYSQSFVKQNNLASHWNLSDKSLILYRLTCIDSVNDIFNIEHYSYGYLLQPGWNKTQLNRLDSNNSLQIFWDNNIAILDDTLLNTLFDTGQPRVWKGKTVLNKTEYRSGYYEGKLTKYPNDDDINGIPDNYYNFKITGLNKALNEALLKYNRNLINYDTDLGNYTIETTNLTTNYKLINSQSQNNDNLSVKEKVWSTILSTNHDLYKFKIQYIDTKGRYYVNIVNTHFHNFTLDYDIPTLYHIYDPESQGEDNIKSAIERQQSDNSQFNFVRWMGLRNLSYGRYEINDEEYFRYSASFVGRKDNMAPINSNSHWNYPDKSLILYRLTYIENSDDLYYIEHYSYGYLLHLVNIADPSQSVYYISGKSRQLFWDNNFENDVIKTKKGYYEGNYKKIASIDEYYRFKIAGLQNAINDFLKNYSKIDVANVAGKIGIDINNPIETVEVNSSVRSINTNNNYDTISFTGQHRCFLNQSNIENCIGLIVETNNSYKNLDNSFKPKINEALPIVTLTETQKSKKVFGVISNSEDDSEYRTFVNGGFITNCLKYDNLNRVYINSLGEGSIWIVNTNGNLKNGDYIQSSNIKGYGEKQDSNILYNYTVAKITCDCNFEMEHNNYDCEEYNDLYRKAFVGCTYHCG